MTSSFHVKTQGIPDILMKFTEQIISKVLEEDEHQAIKWNGHMGTTIVQLSIKIS